MESSRMPNQLGNIEPLPVSVGGGIIEGWSFALQNMKKAENIRCSSLGKWLMEKNKVDNRFVSIWK